MSTAPASIIRLVGLDQLTRFEHEAMATKFVLHLATPSDGSSLRPIAEEAFRLLDRLEERLSFYQEGSDVTRINRAKAGDSFRIDEVTYRCLLDAIAVSAATEGAFDPFTGYAALQSKTQTIPHHLRDLAPPEAGEREPVLAIDPDQPIVTKLAGRRWLDLGAVGKGAALDTMAEVLKEWDIPSAVLSGGGSSLLVFGAPPHGDQDTWTLHLPQSPGNPALQLPAPFALGASGDGFQPGHIIGDPGHAPRPQSLVMAPSAALADALSTAAILLSDQQLKSIIGDDPRFGVFATHLAAAPMAAGTFSQQLKQLGPELSLVIPCWCESQRLPVFLQDLCEAIRRADLSIEILVVDDGSPAPEPERTRGQIDRLRETFDFLRPMLEVPQHEGKGGAIYHGWRNASSTCRWLAFVDADGAVPTSSVMRGISHALATEADLPLIAANRYHHDRQYPVKRDWIRQRTGSWFAHWAQRKLALPARDSQCGFKLVPAGWWRDRNKRGWHELGYAFDLELLQSAKTDGIRTENMNITWQEIGGSNVGLRDGIELVQTVLRMAKAR
mgnify:CR=1 FL=1